MSRTFDAGNGHIHKERNCQSPYEELMRCDPGIGSPSGNCREPSERDDSLDDPVEAYVRGLGEGGCKYIGNQCLTYSSSPLCLSPQNVEPVVDIEQLSTLQAHDGSFRFDTMASPHCLEAFSSTLERFAADVLQTLTWWTSS
jgi:hypothetical protein